MHTNPHLVGRSHPVSVEVREFDWDSSRKGASQLPRTKTIRLSTPKTTTGEILIFALTSPLASLIIMTLLVRVKGVNDQVVRVVQ